MSETVFSPFPLNFAALFPQRALVSITGDVQTICVHSIYPFIQQLQDSYPDDGGDDDEGRTSVTPAAIMREI